MLRHNIISCLILIFTLASTAHGQPAWSISRSPYAPVLTKGQGNPVCEAMEKRARTVFFSTSALLMLYPVTDYNEQYYGSPEFPFPLVKWMPVTLSFEHPNSDQLKSASLDLDGDGTPEFVVYRRNEWSWRGPTYSIVVFPSEKAFFTSMHKSTSIEQLLKTGHSVYSSSWSWKNLFKYRNAYYLLDEGNAFALQTDTNRNISLVTAQGKLETTCTIEFYHPTNSESHVMKQPILKAMESVLSGIGDGGPDCGTLHSSARHANDYSGAELRAKYRPWAVGEDYDFDKVKNFLEAWSNTDPWSMREYQTTLDLRHFAIPEMSRHLRNDFGISKAQAKNYARTTVNALISHYFVIPSSQDSWVDLDDSSSSTEQGESTSIPRRYLEFAIDRPARLKSLLDKGMNPNAGNSFGKTALMYAAHLDQPDAIRILLSYGANINQATNKTTGSGYCGDSGLQRTNRTALMYAAENASLKVIALLVEHGANVDAKDSQGNGISYYLAKNPRLTDKQKSMSITQLLASRDRSDRPGFDCRKARTKIEKTICKDPTLSLYDREMTTAYIKWHKHAGNPIFVRNLQRSWLKRRNSECGVDTEKDFNFCLRLMTRAHTRLLFKVITSEQ